MKNNGLNIKGLCKQIKSEKRHIIWSLSKGTHTITNRHWLIKFDALPREVLVTLLAIFGEFPEEGMLLNNVGYSDTPLKHTALRDESWKPVGDEKPATLTSYLHDAGDSGYLRVFKSEDQFTFVREEYLQAVDQNFGRENIKFYGIFQPIFFADMNYVVLPMRMPKVNDLFTLEELTN
ncbi:hypothetical protein ABER23_08015 [Paenibacillus lautus]|uniref:hypothetical protein n=1 Tax=Paenibacillus lautus TaxID=1401 RepID=UPI003D2697D1